jgi:hypothetical protein
VRDHDEPLADRRERNAADVAARPLANPRHFGRALYAFTDLPSGTEWTTVERYRARWLMEAIEAGDVVVPYAGRWTNELGYSSTAMRRLRFAVFAAGVPPDATEEQLSLTFRYWERMVAGDHPADPRRLSGAGGKAIARANSPDGRPL